MLKRKELNQPILPYIKKELIQLNHHLTIQEVLSVLRRRQHIQDHISYFYVIDHDKKLCGVVPVRSLLVANATTKLSEIMLKDIVSVYDTATVLEVSELFALHKYLALPVVDAKNKLLGTVDISLFADHLSVTFQKKQIDELFQLVGVHLHFGKGTPVTYLRERFPWLLWNVLGGMTCAFIAGFFEQRLVVFTLLALFMPVHLTLAESVSMQSMTMTIHHVVNRKTIWRVMKTLLRKEILTSLLIGTAIGSLMAIIAWLWKGQSTLAIILGISILSSVVMSSIIGVIIPVLVYILRINPKIASGPVVLAIVDTLTLSLFFSLAYFFI